MPSLFKALKKKFKKYTETFSEMTNDSISHFKPGYMIFQNRMGGMLLLTAATIVPMSFHAAERPNDRRDVIVAAWERAKAYTKEYLDAAGEEVYSFKPTAEMRSFGEQMNHLATDNYKITNAAVAGVMNPSNYKDLEKAPPLMTKTEITKAVMDSYDFVIATIKGLDDAKLDIRVKIFNKWETTVEDGLNKAFEHQTHHRGQTTVYLRLKGIIPPKEKLF
jgi:uncharacterized damage-inducible protein DinB